MNDKSIHAGHRERMRKRFESDPLLLNFSEHEILEMLLYYCIPRANTNELERSGIIKRGTAVSLCFLGAVSAYVQRGGGRKVSIGDFAAVKEYVYSCLASETKEVIRLFGVTPSQEIVSSEIISRGLSANVTFDLPLITEAAVRLGCQEVLLAHNHPFSSFEPSGADTGNTQIIARRLESLNIRLLDHLIVGNTGVYSFREHGLISES